MPISTDGRVPSAARRKIRSIIGNDEIGEAAQLDQRLPAGNKGQEIVGPGISFHFKHIGKRRGQKILRQQQQNRCLQHSKRQIPEHRPADHEILQSEDRRMTSSRQLRSHLANPADMAKAAA